MKYIEIYLNERKKEIEQLKQQKIDEIKERFRNCEDNEDYEILIEDIYFDYHDDIYDCNRRLMEIGLLREDLILKEDLESKGE